MITVIGRRLIIPDCDRVLGVIGDKNTPIRIKLSESTLETYLPGTDGFGSISVILKLKHEASSVSLPPVLCVHGKDGVYTGNLSILSSVKPGLVTAQAMIVLPGSAAEDEALNDAERIWQSDEDYFYIAEDVQLESFNSGSDEYTAFQNLLAAVSNKVTAAEAAAFDAESYKTEAEKAKEAAEAAEQNANSFSLSAEDNADRATTARNESVIASVTAASSAKEAQNARNEAVGLIGGISGHLKDYGNPHGVTASQVGSYSKDEADEKLSGKANTDEVVKAVERISAHIEDMDNPHGVTAALVGAAPVGHAHELTWYSDSDLTEMVSSFISVIEGAAEITDNGSGVTITGSDAVIGITSALPVDGASCLEVFLAVEAGAANNFQYISPTLPDGFASLMPEKSFTAGDSGYISSAGYVEGEYVITFAITDAVMKITGLVHSERSNGFMSAQDKRTLDVIKNNISGLEERIGDIENALDGILAIQDELIGGVSV